MTLYYQIGKLSALGRLLALHLGPLKPHNDDFSESRQYILVSEDGVKKLPGVMVNLTILASRYTKTEKKTDIVRDLIEKGKVE